MHRARACLMVSLVFLVLAGVTGSRAAPPDGVVLSVTLDPGSGEAGLEWAGKREDVGRLLDLMQKGEVLEMEKELGRMSREFRVWVEQDASD